MPLNKAIKKVLVIGSGPITIGQAAEFDYAGTQACRALKEEELEVVLVNSNPATIMTDENTADRVYIEPLTIDFLEKVIEKERPDALLPTLGGQTGLNLSIRLSEEDILEKYGVKLIGTNLETIKKSEDRELFKNAMLQIGEPVANSIIAQNFLEAFEFSSKAGFPLIVRPAFTLGGSGGGIANNAEELRLFVERGISYSLVGQVLIEKSLLGWKEIEYEVMRDGSDNCITICNMENIDPVGIHTGDSMVVVPSQTLTDREYQMLRSASIKIIRDLKIEGGCNVQFALNPNSMAYCVIEVNPRVSRSSALASKAAGYPIARIAAKIAVGYTLDEIQNPITKTTTACFEPTLDYVVVKIPRWPFDKFKAANRSLDTQMKATGEVMTIDRSFEAALMKAIRSLDVGAIGLFQKDIHKKTDYELEALLRTPNDLRLWVIAEALRRNQAMDFIEETTGINPWFINKIHRILLMEQALIKNKSCLEIELLADAKAIGYSDREVALLTGQTEGYIKRYRFDHGIKPVCKIVDTCAAEFDSSTAYYYTTYDQEDEVAYCSEKNVLVLGSGSIRIGQGIEFDYCAVHAAAAIRKMGCKAIIINNNPETVSTDFDTSDRLYFEPLYIEDIMNIVEREQPLGVVVQFGGQTAINAAKELAKRQVTILGTDFAAIDIAEDREKFDYILSTLDIKRPMGMIAADAKEAKNSAARLGFPLLVRPSYVIGGQSMRLVQSMEALYQYLQGVYFSEEAPLLIDKYVEGMEVEVDALCDGEKIFIPGIMEHIERTGIHSGDSMSVFPAPTLNQIAKDKIIDITEKIALALGIKGLINIQYAILGNEVYVIEANPRASRTIPIISKVTGVPMVELAMRIMLGEKLADMGYKNRYQEIKGLYAVKSPSFSFEKIPNLDNLLGPEMKSTGEVMGLDINLDAARYKAFIAAGYRVYSTGQVLLDIPDKELDKWHNIKNAFDALGFQVTLLQDKERAASYEEIKQAVKHKKYQYVISTDSLSYDIRRTAVENRVDCLTTMDTVTALLKSIAFLRSDPTIDVRALQDYVIYKCC